MGNWDIKVGQDYMKDSQCQSEESIIILVDNSEGFLNRFKGKNML